MLLLLFSATGGAAPYVIEEIEEALWSILYGDGGVSGIVSARIYPQKIPQNTAYPALRYEQVGGMRDSTLGGTPNMVHARFQIDSIASTLLAGRTLADTVRARLDNYHGTTGTVVIQCVHLIDEQDYFEELVGVDQLRKYGKTQDYMVWYNE